MPSPAFQQYIDSFINYELRPVSDPDATFKPQRIRECLRQLGNPQRSLKCIHIAGTKGKGSTAAFLAHILCEAGFLTGLYTSPHLYSLNERIRVLDPQRRSGSGSGLFPDAISDRELDDLLTAKQPVLEQFRNHSEFGALTYFEVLTALAFCYFDQRRVDFVVLETGLGGRLDATNTVDPIACGLTVIGLDHTAQLGPTVGQIAHEKIAIVKPGKPMVVAPQVPEAAAVIRAHGRENRNRMVFVADDITFSMRVADMTGQSFLVQDRGQDYDLKTALLGSFQMINAAVAVGLAGVLKESGYEIPAAAVRRGIANTFWPGRFEVLTGKPTVIVDAAHNSDSVRALAENIRTYFPHRDPIVVLGMSRDKDVEAICRIIKTTAGQVIPARAQHARSYDFSDALIRQLLGLGTGEILSTPGAVQTALKIAGADDLILITGSIFVVAEAREMLVRSQDTGHTPHGTGHTPHATRHTPHVTRHTACDGGKF